MKQRIEKLTTVLTSAAAAISWAEKQILELQPEIERLQSENSVMRQAIEKAASAPGIDWLAEQLELGKVLIDLDKAKEVTL